jgi:DNA repair exonuclease SbcCD ATPase subunit
MITFQKVIIKNFFSVGNTPITIDLNNSPTTAVVGTNGCGKSSCIVDSIFFACFGSPFRNINIPNVINSINSSDCLVELFLKSGTKNFKIIRGLKPKIFEIYENDVLLDQAAHSKDYQEYLETTILNGMNSRIFKQIVIMGSASYIPFMQLTSAARREVIEELLDIKIFSNMLDLAKVHLTMIKEILTGLDNDVNLINEKISIHEENKKRLEVDIDIKKRDIEKKIRFENEDIEILNKEIVEMSVKKSSFAQKYLNFDVISTTRKGFEHDSIEYKNHIKSASKTIDFFTNHQECPTCSQQIDENHKKGLLFTSQKELDAHQQCLKLAKEQIDKHDVILETLNKVKLIMDKLDNDIFKNQTEISTKLKYIAQLQKELNQSSNTSKVMVDNVEHLKKDSVGLKEKRIKVLEERQYYEVISNLLKDGGIKTKIIRQYIPVFNKIINEYLTRFGLPIEFTLDAEFNEVIKSRYRDKFQYNNLSQGERQRVDLALMFSWREIAKSKNTLNTNLLIFDETLDQSLDETATEELINILLGMDKKQNIFVISHKTNLDNKMRSVLKFKKNGNFTTLV